MFRKKDNTKGVRVPASAGLKYQIFSRRNAISCIEPQKEASQINVGGNNHGCFLFA